MGLLRYRLCTIGSVLQLELERNVGRRQLDSNPDVVWVDIGAYVDAYFLTTTRSEDGLLAKQE